MQVSLAHLFFRSSRWIVTSLEALGWLPTYLILRDLTFHIGNFRSHVAALNLTGKTFFNVRHGLRRQGRTA